MNVVLKWSVILVAAVTVLNVILVATGLHAGPVGGMVFIVVATLLNIAVIFLALRETRSEKSYGGQLAQGALIGLVAGVLIFLTSWLVLSVVFPDSIQQLKDGYTAFLESAPLDEDRRQAQITAIQSTTAMAQAQSGLIGTFFTSLLVAAIVAIFQRRK